MIKMGESINNFINLLVRGDFFLIFLIIMMVIIIGVIVYLVRLQIHDTDYYEKDEVEDEEDEDYDDYVLDDRDLDKTILEETKAQEKPTISSVDYEEDIDEQEYDDREEVISTIPNMSVSLDEDDEEDDHTYDNLERPVPVMIKEESPVRHVEQSRFDFDNEEVVNSIKDFEDEQEATAIISATELESRINEMKANGQYEEHERKLQEYEKEQETKAIISYEELLKRASTSSISYESEENIDGIHVGKVDTSNIEHYSETNDKPYYKEEAFLEAMKEFRRAL